MTIQLYNTLAREKQPFEPADPNRVTMYVCGPTVYSYAHIGNARAAVVFDVLARLLRREFPEVIYARNITDVDDKINKAARDQGVDIRVITEKYAQVYRDDMAALGVLPPDIEPRVTDNMDAIIQMIQAIIDNGHAYEAEGHVLFHVPSYEDYGQLSRRDRKEMVAGARVEVAPYKKDPADFVLWKPSDDETPGWDSPWGRGRPGWHVECSAMIERHLGETIDIHGGGNDLIFPHHENEIAQGTCAHGGKLYSRYWLHNGFLNVNQEKMSKSLGNVLLVHDLLERAPGEAIRLALLMAHYRQPLDWSDEGLEQAQRKLDQFYHTLRDLPEGDSPEGEVPDALMDALRNDLNTPEALAQLDSLRKQANAAEDDAERAQLRADLIAAGDLLGLLQDDPERWLKQGAAGDEDDADRIEAQLQAREEARKARDFAKADAIRDELLAEGIVIEDSPEGPRWRRNS